VYFVFSTRDSYFGMLLHKRYLVLQVIVGEGHVGVEPNDVFAAGSLYNHLPCNA
jgi:hypothetical protein